MLEVAILRVLFLQASNSRTPCSLWIPVSPKLSGRPSKATYHHGPPTCTHWAATGCASRTGTASTASWPGSSPAVPGTSQPGSAGQVRPPCAAGAPNGWPPGCSTSSSKRRLPATTRSSPLDLSEVATGGSLHKALCGGEGTGPNPTDRAKIGWKWSIATDLLADPHRLGHRRSEPQRQHPARTNLASRRRPRPARRRPDPAPGQGLRQLAHHPTLPRPRTHRRRLRQEDAQGRTQGHHFPQGRTQDPEAPHRQSQDQEDPQPGPALARRTNQLLVLQLRPAPPQHRSVQQTTPRPGRTRRRPHPDRETRQMGQTMDRLNPPIRARSKWKPHFSQSPNHPHISGRPRISEVFSLAVHPSLCNAKTGPKGWKKPRPRPDCRLRLRRLIRARWRCSRCGSNRHGPEASHQWTFALSAVVR